MVEVFKTNVQKRSQASLLVERIQQAFPGYEASFDLEDCDKVLRVVFNLGAIHTALLMRVLNNHGFHAEILPDTPPLIQPSIRNQTYPVQYAPADKI
jgi:hypothetical protein